MPRRKSFALVFNARAGVARPKLLDGVLAGLKGAGAEVFQLPARTADEASQRVADLAGKRGADAVIAAGGDGTFRAVATGAAGTDLSVGYIPLGTGNVLAYELGLRKRAADLAQGLLGHPVIPVQGGLVNGKPFFLMTGCGFDARIIRSLNYKTKRIFARAAYTLPVCKTLLRGPEVFDVDVDGQALAASWVIVTRASHYGGSFVLTRETQLGRPEMMAILFDAKSRFAMLKASAGLAFGRHAHIETRGAGVTVLNAKRVQIGRRVIMPVQVDGDEAGVSPADVVAGGPTVRLIVPPAYVADLTNCHTNHLHLQQ